MENQNDKNVIPALLMQALGKLGAMGADFAGQVDGAFLALRHGSDEIARLPLPVKMGTVLNFITRYARRSSLDDLPDSLSIGPYLFYPRQSRLKQGEADIILTDKERDILAALWLAPDKALPRDALLDRVWAYAQGVETHTLETHIYRLRQKIETDPGTPRWLVNEDGVYRLNA